MIRIALILAIAIGCGPSQREVALAKMARYKADKLQLFELARSAVERKHKILNSDETTLTIITRGRWYTPDGLASQWSVPNDTIDNSDAQRGTRQDPFDTGARPALPDKSFYISLTIRLLPEESNWVVFVDSKVARFNIGMPILEPIDTKRIDTPGWVNGKVDQLAYEIYKSMRSYQVQGLSGSSPQVPFDPTPITSEPKAEPHPVDLPGINSGSDSGSGSGSGSAPPP
ncbi:MAG: hypothetical protein H0V17_14240 [Deltaproteobacteria bacterium]|nr:hypothetical protein [Deltaproteobacteria bacterium]